jgi:hypothetical protein
MIPVGSAPVFTNPGAFRAARGRLSPPGALAERAPNLASAFRCIQVQTFCRSNRNAVLTLVAGISPLRTARLMESVLTPMKAASSLIDRVFVFMCAPWLKVLSTLRQRSGPGN